MAIAAAQNIDSTLGLSKMKTLRSKPGGSRVTSQVDVNVNFAVKEYGI